MAKVYDVTIVGGGPAGLAAAVNGASEGLSVVILDAAMALGGQARESSCIENYPMPLEVHNGVGGESLMLGFQAQAEKFGAELVCPAAAVHLESKDGELIVTTNTFREYHSRSVILSMGLYYRTLNATGIARFMKRSVFYGLPTSRSFANKHIAVVGGANSAGQAVVRLAKNPTTKVTLLARSPINRQMSAYLVNRIRNFPNVEVCENAEVQECHGTHKLECITVTRDGVKTELAIDLMAIFIGGIPHTAWLLGSVELDPKRFILTDTDLPTQMKRLQRETSIPGVFAAGDVCFGQTVKRVIGAASDGALAITSIHRYLGDRE